MEQITNPILLKEEATRGQVALAYGIIGALVGVFVLGKK